MTKKTFELDREVSEEIERRFYITESYKAMLSVMCKSYSETPSDNLKRMIEDYRTQYQKTWVEFTCAKNALFNQLLGHLPVQYKFDFYKQEVECEW